MSSRKESRYAAIVSLFGAAAWAAVATLAGLHRVRLGIIELLVLFAPLVVVPLGLELANALEFSPESPLAGVLRVLQSLAALAACASLWIPPGQTSAILSSLWLLVCALLAFSRLFNHPRTGYSLPSFALDVGHIDLILGAVWFVVSRAGWRPMGFQEPIILLTAVHFHYSGFATAVIAAAALSTVRRSGWTSFRMLVLLAVLLPFALAAGFVFSRILRFIAAMALAIVIIVLAGILFWCAREFRSTVARIYLRSAACAAWAALSLAALYAVGEYFHKDWITVPGMANSHGVLNALGFVLLGLLGWLTELHAVETSNGQDGRRRIGVYAQSQERQPVDPPMLPEFVARDFYDR
jgi:hypothetical protein